MTRGQTVLEDDWSSTTTRRPTYCPWLLSRRGTDCEETGTEGTEGAEAAKPRSRRGDEAVQEEPRERSWTLLSGPPAAPGKAELREQSSPAFCSADPISNIPIPVICRVLNSPGSRPTAKQASYFFSYSYSVMRSLVVGLLYFVFIP